MSHYEGAHIGELRIGDIVRAQFKPPAPNQKPIVYEGVVERVSRDGYWVCVLLPASGQFANQIARRFRITQLQVLRGDP